jgi:hypothetical protein
MDWRGDGPDPTRPLAAVPLRWRLRTRQGRPALPTADCTVQVYRWRIPDACAGGSILVVQLRLPGQAEWRYSWRFAVGPLPTAATMELWHALTHVFRRTGMPATLHLPGPATLDQDTFGVVMSLILYDWHRPPPRTAVTPPRDLPLNHLLTLQTAATAASTTQTPFRANLPPGYLTHMPSLPGPPLPRPFQTTATFTAWMPVTFDLTDEECEDAA